MIILFVSVVLAQRNECELGVDTCDKETQNCYDTFTSYLCLCKNGFKFNGGECHDIDECEQDQFLCPALSGCVNTVGSYECRCVTGYDLRKGMNDEVLFFNSKPNFSLTKETPNV